MDALALTASDHSQRQPEDVYKRLHDVRSYTGVYRKRFELKINDLTDTVVHDLAGTVRPNLNHDVENRPRRPTLTPRRSLTPLNTAATVANETLASVQQQSPERPAPCPSPVRLEGDPNDPHTLLRAVFHYYCRFGRTGSKGANETTMDNANFSKLCRECPGLLDTEFTRTDVDLIFIKSKKKGERRVNYTRFLDALGMIAIQKYPGMSLEASVPMLLQAHISNLPCVVEFNHGKQVQAVWSLRFEHNDSQALVTLSAPPSPPSRRASTSQASPPKAGGAATPPAAPPRSPRLFRRFSSPSNPPTSVVSDRELRRSKSKSSSPGRQTRPSTVTADFSAAAQQLILREGQEDEHGDDTFCFAS